MRGSKRKRTASSAILAMLLSSSLGHCHARVPSQSAFITTSKRVSILGNTHQIKGFSTLVSGAPSPRSRGLFLSSEVGSDEADSLQPPSDESPSTTGEAQAKNGGMKRLLSDLPFFQFFNQESDTYKKPPPLQVEDSSLLFYDVFLLLNLSLSISFWVVHRMSLDYIGIAVSEGSLLCILWILAGLGNGAFLNSAVDGHYGAMSEKGGPKAAGMLGLHTFISTANLRIVVALVMAVLEHRKVGDLAGEQLIPLEILFGLVLMSCWRALHSSFVPRV